MIDKYITLLKTQIEKLDEESFDLEAWKSSTIVVLSRIFGDHSSKINQIEKIRFELGSWSLRDASGHSDQMHSCKMRGKAILDACITELEILGTEEESQGDTDEEKALVVSIQDELKMSQYKELLTILKTKSGVSEKKKLIMEKLQSYGSEVSPAIISNILTDPSFKKVFK